MVLKARWVPDDLVNGFVLGGALLIFGVAEGFIGDAGLLAVTLAGAFVGFSKPKELRQLRAFKGEVVDLLIGLLFLLLTARLSFEDFSAFGWEGVAVVGLVLFLVRPLNIWVSSWSLEISWRERIFLSWVAPRGIVAASMAALFTWLCNLKGMLMRLFCKRLLTL